MWILTSLSSSLGVPVEQISIVILLAIVTVGAVYLSFKAISKMTAEQKITLFNRFIKEAIHLAEKELGAGKGKEKKQMVLDYLTKVPPFPISTIFSMITVEQLDFLIERIFKFLQEDPNDFIILNPTQKSQIKK